MNRHSNQRSQPYSTTMITKTILSLFAAFLSVSPALASYCPRYDVQVVSGTAHNIHQLTPTVQKYRDLLGGEDNANNPPTFGVGQRSINWDAAIVPFNMPNDFFNTRVPRGAIFHAKNKKFAVSNPADNNPIDDRFSSLLPSFVTKQFQRFSLKRLFTPIDRNRVNVKFNIPGTHKKALVRGFGAVFTDVDFYGKTHMKFFDKKGCFITKVKVPAKDRGLSFVGIVTKNKHGKQVPVIAKVQMKLGNISVGKFRKLWYGRKIRRGDLVVVDDLIYGEPAKW